MADKKKSKEEIVEGFNKLRQEQRSIASKIAELEADKMEHNLVIEALNEVKTLLLYLRIKPTTSQNYVDILRFSVLEM